MVDDALRHFWIFGVLGILDHREAAAHFDRPHAEGAVIELPAENHADDSWPMGHGRRTKEGINGRSIPVLSGPFRNQDMMRFQQQMAVRRGDVEMPSAKTLLILGQRAWEA